MSDSAVNITAGTGTAIDTRTESTNGNHRQVVVLGDPATNAGVAPVDATNGLSVNLTNSVVHVDDNSSTLSVDDGGGSITVDASSLPLPTGASTGAKQDTGNTSLASIDGKITAVNTGAVVISSGSLTADTELTTKDYDTGAGTDTQAVVGILLPKSGGAVVGGTSTDPIRTDPTGSTTQPVSGTFWQSTQPVSIADGSDTTLGAKADAKSTATDTTSVSIMSVLKQISASVQAPPSQAVTNAGTFAVQATLAAETTKVIGTVRTADGYGNLYTTNSTTYTAKFGQDTNLLGTLGTAFSTAGKVDVKGADGDVFVRQSTASNLNAQVVGNVANDGAASGNPVRIAGKYSASPAKISTDGDVIDLALTQEGKLLDIHSTAAADTTNVNNNYSSAQTNTSQQSAPGANKRIVVVEIIYSKDTAGTMKLVEDPAGTPATKFGPHYFPANGGMVATKCYIPLTANKALGLTTTGGGNETLTARTIIENV